MGFHILKSDLNDLGDKFADHSNDANDRFGEVGNSITALSELSSFTGAAADAIKAYFADVHVSLAASIAALAQQLCSDYFAKYLDRYTNDPLHENDWGKLNEDELTNKKAWVRDQQERWDVIDSQLSQAISALPGGVVLSKPNAQAARAELTKLEASLSQLIANVHSVEANGKNAFAADSTEFSRLLGSIDSAISQCKYDMSTYEAGAFNAVLEATGLREAFNASLEDCEANAEKMIQNQEIMYDQLCEREVRKQEEERAFWDGVGFALGVGLLIVGVAATIATAGTATPVVAGLTYALGSLSAVKTGADLVNRGNKLMGKEESDLVSAVKSTTGYAKDVIGVGKPGAKQIDLLRSEHIDKIDSKLADRLDRHRTTQMHAKGASVVTGVVTDLGADQIKEELNSPEGDLLVDTGKRAVDEFVDHQFDKIGAIKPKSYSVGKADAASLVLGVAQDGADYKSAKCDEAIAKAQQQCEEKKAKADGRGIAQQYAWAVGW